MDVIGIILARKGSKRLPGKNSKKFNGQPLIEWTIQAAKKSRLKKVILSTDCEKCMQIGIENKIMVYTRPIELRGDDVKSADVMIRVMEDETAHKYVMLLQPTSPLRDFHDINCMIESFRKIEETTHRQITMASYNEATKQPNGAMYMTRWVKLINDKDFIIDYPFMMPQEKSFDIDTIYDFNKAEKAMRKHASD